MTPRFARSAAHTAYRLATTAIVTFALVAGAVAASPSQSALRPVSDQAVKISHLWWLYLTVLGIIWGLVMASVLRAAFRARLTPATEELVPMVPPPKGPDRILSLGVTLAVSATVFILLALLFVDFFTDRAISSPAPPDAMT